MHRAVLLLSLCATVLVAGPPPKPIHDSSLGYPTPRVRDTCPATPQDEGSAPGEKPLPSASTGNTPIIRMVFGLPSHHRSSNLCMDCHAVRAQEKG